MFKIIHPDPGYEINNSRFATRQEAEAHMKVIQKYAKEFVLGGWTQEQANSWVASFTITEQNETV